jgi:hypothetical protein
MRPETSRTSIPTAPRTLQHVASQPHPPALALALEGALRKAGRPVTAVPPPSSDQPEAAE